MRTAYGMIGIGILVIVGGLYLVNHPFTSSTDTSGESTASTSTMSSTLSLKSPEFSADGSIPSKYTCDGDKVNPPLTIDGVPEAARSLVLLMNDPDVPKALKPDGNFDHWVLFNIPVSTLQIAAGMSVGTPGQNGAGKNEYAAPCPPAQYKPSEHRYFFKLYALDAELPLKAGASKAEVEKAMVGHVISETQLVGTYKRQ